MCITLIENKLDLSSNLEELGFRQLKLITAFNQRAGGNQDTKVYHCDFYYIYI